MPDVKKRVAMIGLDAADIDFIELQRAHLPNLQRALEVGRMSRLHSTADLLTGSVWPTFCTGSLPGVHGIYHHLQWDPDQMSLRRVSPDWLSYEPFWYELQRRGLKVIAVDVPMTFPSPLRQGVEVVSWGSHDILTPFTAYPDSVKKEIQKRFGKHPMGTELTVNKTQKELERIRSGLLEGARRKGELCRWLLNTHEWDFFIAVFGECHRGGHIFWPQGLRAGSPASEGPLLDVYKAVDGAVGELMRVLSDSQTTLILFALHGMGPNFSQEHFVPKVMDRVNSIFKEKSSVSSASARPKGQHSIMRVLREKLPPRLQHAIGRAVPVSVRDAVVKRSITGGYNWKDTPGFPLAADLTGYLRLNLHGRERDGMLLLGSDHLTKYQDWVCQSHQSLRIEETGEPLVKEIYFASKEFPGSRSSFLPDIIVKWTEVDPVTRTVSDSLGIFESTIATGRTGNHRPDGFCITIEPRAKDGGFAPPSHIKELAGAILSQLIS